MVAFHRVRPSKCHRTDGSRRGYLVEEIRVAEKKVEDVAEETVAVKVVLFWGGCISWYLT